MPQADIEAWQLDICEMQGHLLELAWRRGYPMKAFVSGFMSSDIAARLDAAYSRFQWMGEEYALSAVAAELGLVPGCRPDDVDTETLFWMGYTYRYWHYLTGETSREMYAVADYERIRTVYAGYHTLSCELAIRRLKDMVNK